MIRLHLALPLLAVQLVAADAAAEKSASGSPSRTFAWSSQGYDVDIATLGDFFTIDRNLTGPITLRKLGLGELRLTGTNTHTGGTRVEGGILRIGDGQLNGSIAGDILNHGLLEFDRQDDVTFTGRISGRGAVHHLGSGTMTLTADQPYTGITVLAGGSLRLGDGGASGSLAGDIYNHGGVLIFDRQDTLTIPGGVHGYGTMVQAGSGTTVLNGLNTAAGTIVVAAGTLRAGRPGAFGSPGVAGASTESAASGARAGSIRIDVHAGATLDTANSPQMLGGLRNAGTVTLHTPIRGDAAGAPPPGNVLTVRGDYVGAGGLLRLRTSLGGSDSPTDRLVIDGGRASGRTFIAIVNTGGLGALTKGNGIEVIRAINGATTTAQTTRDAFALRDGHVDAGAYEYRLYPADQNGAGESWYLRSTVPAVAADASMGATAGAAGSAEAAAATAGASGSAEAGAAAAGATGSTEAAAAAAGAAGSTEAGAAAAGASGSPEAGAAAAGAAGSTEAGAAAVGAASSAKAAAAAAAIADRPAGRPAPRPAYRPEAALYAALPAMLAQVDLAMLGTLHQREGDGAIATARDAGASGRRAWGRLIDQNTRIRQQGTVAPRSDGWTSGMQLGTDLYAGTHHRAGIYGGTLGWRHHVHGDASGTQDRAVGRLHGRSNAIGGYWTYVDDAGWYGDLVVQYSHQHGKGIARNSSGNIRGHGTLVSLEAGAPLRLSERWTAEPQAQLVAGHRHIDDVAIPAATVRQHPGNAVTARLGLRLKGDYAGAHGQVWPYARVNLWHGLAGTDTQSIQGPGGQARLSAARGYTSGHVAAGGAWSINRHVGLYGEIGRLFPLGGAQRVSAGHAISAGVRIAW